MRKHLSVFMLMAQHSFYKILAILILSAVLQLGFSYYLITEKIVQIQMIEVIAQKLPLFFQVSFILIFALLLTTTAEQKGKERYTLMRLAISEKKVFFWQSLYNFFAFSLLYLVQILVAIGVSFMFVNIAPAEYVSEQTIFLAFYRSDFFNALLPTVEDIIFVRNVASILAFSMISAFVPMRGKRALKTFLIAFSGFFTYWGFLNIHSFEVIYIHTFLVVPCMIGVILYQVLTKEVCDELT